MPKAKTSAPKKSAPKAKKSQPKVVEPVVETPVVDTPVVDTPSINAEGNNVAAPQMLDYDAELLVLENQLRDAMALVKSAMSGLTAHKRKVARERKLVEKKMRVKVKRVKDPNAPPSGFEKPLEVSKELHKFLSLPDGDLIARTEVTRAITAYCKKHNLQNPDDKRQINADKTLTKLLRLGKEDTLTFFNLQKFLKPHYPNKDGVIEA
jgi:hypothetical protein